MPSRYCPGSMLHNCWAEGCPARPGWTGPCAMIHTSGPAGLGDYFLVETGEIARKLPFELEWEEVPA